MGGKYKERLIPEQNRRICGSICVCQFTMVMSCVALVYLTVAIYMPSHRAFRSGLEPVPVVCQTTATVMASNCQWASCGEWCLTKTSGVCPQINVTVRRNGSDLLFVGCERITRHACPPVVLEKLHKFNCNNGSECERLSGVFQCHKGHCINMSAEMLCPVRADGPRVNSERDNAKLNGNFQCERANCTKIKHHLNCDRICNTIDGAQKNVFVVHGDDVVGAACARAEALHEANGTEPGRAVNATEFWPSLPPADDGAPAAPSDALLVACREVAAADGVIHGVDCVNGSLARRGAGGLPDSFNFTAFRAAYAAASARPADPAMRYAPLQAALTIYPSSRLQINLEACVNTLQDECKAFVETHGKDGRNDTAQSQFPCFFDKGSGAFVVARFDLEKTLRDLVVAVAVPAALFVLSWASLCVITRSVKVGDDARMRCQYCAGGADPEECALAPGPARAHARRRSSDSGAAEGLQARAAPAPAPDAANDDDEETELVLAVPAAAAAAAAAAAEARRALHGRDNRALSFAA